MQANITTRKYIADALKHFQNENALASKLFIFIGLFENNRLAGFITLEIL
ncbi:hypothetical protein L289_0116 [Acinetobacter gerneri DSM 14967 = CIP 107464 = MTCC 9824]|nr:hypothetical protein [Acinetobacter gerneri]EPR85623.1 hypothetical protein L289_0116 [Acinetobacter gerneri DSM 14967 = CIP 107464 = MTCC 9824]